VGAVAFGDGCTIAIIGDLVGGVPIKSAFRGKCPRLFSAAAAHIDWVTYVAGHHPRARLLLYRMLWYVAASADPAGSRAKVPAMTRTEAAKARLLLLLANKLILDVSLLIHLLLMLIQYIFFS
jgi:hypothetical protein